MTGVAATVAASELRVEIVGERRRAYDAAFRARVVAESFLPGARAAELAQRHGICKSLIYRWRRVDAPGAAGFDADQCCNTLNTHISSGSDIRFIRAFGAA